MKTGELSTGVPTLSKCCNAEESWRDCSYWNFHKGGECFATFCEECLQITYRDCDENECKKCHEHHWECTDTPAVFKCINKVRGEKCPSIRVYDRDTETYTVSYTYKKAQEAT